MTQKIFITSDNHFSHKRIAEFCPKTRPHTDWQKMDEMMIRQWQLQVQQNDIVYMLGDCFWSNATDACKIMERLPGQKHLIYGNHDKVIKSNAALRSMFTAVQDYKEIKVDGNRCVLFHFPIQEWHKIERGAVHFHGHIHYRLSGVSGRIVNVCVDSPEMSMSDAPYALYPIQDAVKWALTKPVGTHHEIGE